MHARFQSAPPVKGAIGNRSKRERVGTVSIRAPREGGDDLTGEIEEEREVSIRAPREGGDGAGAGVNGNDYGFNPRPP